MSDLMTDAQILEAVKQLERGRGSLSFSLRENRDRVWKMANARRLSTYRNSFVSIIDDHYVYDLFAADLGLYNVKSERKLYSVTVGR